MLNCNYCNKQVYKEWGEEIHAWTCQGCKGKTCCKCGWYNGFKMFCHWCTTVEDHLNKNKV